MEFHQQTYLPPKYGEHSSFPVNDKFVRFEDTMQEQVHKLDHEIMQLKEHQRRIEMDSQSFGYDHSTLLQQIQNNLLELIFHRDECLRAIELSSQLPLEDRMLYPNPRYSAFAGNPPLQQSPHQQAFTRPGYPQSQQQPHQAFTPSTIQSRYHPQSQQATPSASRSIRPGYPQHPPQVDPNMYHQQRDKISSPNPMHHIRRPESIPMEERRQGAWLMLQRSDLTKLSPQKDSSDILREPTYSSNSTSREVWDWHGRMIVVDRVNIRGTNKKKNNIEKPVEKPVDLPEDLPPPDFPDDEDDVRSIDSLKSSPKAVSTAQPTESKSN